MSLYKVKSSNKNYYQNNDSDDNRSINSDNSFKPYNPNNAKKENYVPYNPNQTNANDLFANNIFRGRLQKLFCCLQA